MNSTGQQSLPRPGPACGAFVDLLPLLSAGTLEEQEEHRLRLHLAGCAYCRVQQSTYDRVDLALRRAFGAPEAISLSPEEMMALPDRGQRSNRDASSGPERFQPPQGRHTRRMISLLSALAAVLLIIVVVTAIVVSRAALPSNTGTHPVVSSPTPTPTPLPETPYVPNQYDGFGGLQMLSPTEGWLVGDVYLDGAATPQPGSGSWGALILHYHDGHWLRQAAPSNAQLGVSSAELYSIAMASANEGWALGSSTGGTFILHYSGGRWTRYGSLMRDTGLFGVQMLSPTDGWMVGEGNTAVAGGHTSVILHYNGARWAPVQAPPVGGIGSLDMLSATDGWATGEGAILHYDGRQWSVFQQVPQIIALSMGSASDGWAYGGSPSAPDGTLLWHYNGKQWVQGPTITSGSLTRSANVYALSMDSATDGWAVGVEGSLISSDNNSIPLYLHYSQGHWTRAQGPNVGIGGLTMLSADEGWATGYGGVLVHYLHGTWTQYHF